MTRDHEFERHLVELLRWLKRTGQEASTRRGQTLVIRPRRPKVSRIDGKKK